jgi:hypothetical protein
MKSSKWFWLGLFSLGTSMIGSVSVHAQTMAPAVQAALVNAPAEVMAAQPAPSTEAAVVAVANMGAVAAPNGIRMFRGIPEEDMLRDMASRPVARVTERFNSSTLVFHCVLEGGMEVAFKPAREGERDWWIHEIAGYELARSLGIVGRVPPAVYKRIPVTALDGFTRDANLEVERDGMVEGAAIFWMPVLRRSNIQTPESRAEWNPWLDPANTIPEANMVRATQISSLIVFDYLQANFDRWNSANVPQDENGDLIFRDNNRAWYLQNLHLYTRGGIDNLRRIPASLLSAVERTTGNVLARHATQTTFPVLNRVQVREYEVRRRALIAKINEAITEYGRDHVVIDDSAHPIAQPTEDTAVTTPASPVESEATSSRRHRHRHRHEHGASHRSHHHHGHGEHRHHHH